MNSTAAKRKLAKGIREFREDRTIRLKQKEMDPSGGKYRQGAVQDYLPLKDIVDGVFLTKDGRYVACMEFTPVNFFKMTQNEQGMIARAFSRLYLNGPVKISIEILADQSNPGPLVESVYKNCPKQEDPKIAESLNDYVNHVYRLSTTASVTHRFFVEFEYSGENGEKSKNQAEIIRTMNETKKYFAQTLAESGNVLVKEENENLQLAKYLYYVLNRNTSRRETFESRYRRVMSDFAAYNREYGTDKQPTMNDMVGPKGLSFAHHNFVVMDGLYYGYIGVTGDSWPMEVPLAWTNIFMNGKSPDIDVKFISRKLPKEQLIVAIKQLNRMTLDDARQSERKGKIEKAIQKGNKYNSDKSVYDALVSGDEIYDTAILITVRAGSQEELFSKVRLIQKQMKNTYGIQTEDASLCAEQYFLMSLPFLYFTKPFGRLKHNTLSSKMATMYPFILYELFDKNGAVIGINEDNNTLCGLDNFNTGRYPNGNMIILGSSGSGKTFAQQVIANGLFLNGIMCRFIIPKKGYEYKGGCDLLGGEYAKLGPGERKVVNPYAIRPEGKIDLTKINTDNTVLDRGTSLRAKKCNFIVSWLNLQLDAPMPKALRQKTIQCLNAMYEEFGITADNVSIYEDKGRGILKKMPTASDFQRAIEGMPGMEDIASVNGEYVSGSFANMDAQTNVDYDNPYIIFDVDEDDIGTDLAPAFQYLAFDCVYNDARANPAVKKAIFLDEIWKMLKDANSAAQIENAIRIVRGYGACVIEATQQLYECINSPGGFGKAIMGNSEIKVLLGMQSEDAKVAQEVLSLSKDEKEKIMHFKRGHGMVVSRNDKIDVEFIGSERQRAAYSTDVNEKMERAGNSRQK